MDADFMEILNGNGSVPDVGENIKENMEVRQNQVQKIWRWPHLPQRLQANKKLPCQLQLKILKRKLCHQKNQYQKKMAADELLTKI